MKNISKFLMVFSALTLVCINLPAQDETNESSNDDSFYSQRFNTQRKWNQQSDWTMPAARPQFTAPGTRRYQPEDNNYTVINRIKVFNGFVYLLDDPVWNCWAQSPLNDYQVHRCRYCRQIYYSQYFLDKDGKRRRLFSGGDNCSGSSTGCCDNHRLKEIGPCKCGGNALYNPY